MTTAPEMPFVTIGVPAFNAGRYIGETLSSLVAQTYSNREILVADNASTDDTGEIARSFSPLGVRYRRHPANIGSGPNFNWIIESARGDLVALYHADDVYHPSIVAREVRFLQDHPESACVFTLDDHIDESGTVIGESRLPDGLSGDQLFSFAEVLPLILKHGNAFLRMPSLMIRKEAFVSVGPFDHVSFSSAGDLDLWLRLSKRFRIGVIADKLFRYRLSTTHHTFRYHDRRTEPWDYYEVLDRHLTPPPSWVSRALLRRFEDEKMSDLAACAANCILSGRSAQGRDLLRRSVSWRLFIEAVPSWKCLRHFLKRLLFLGSTEIGLGEAYAGLSARRKKGTGRDAGKPL